MDRALKCSVSCTVPAESMKPTMLGLRPKVEFVTSGGTSVIVQCPRVDAGTTGCGRWSALFRDRDPITRSEEHYRKYSHERTASRRQPNHDWMFAWICVVCVELLNLSMSSASGFFSCPKVVVNFRMTSTIGRAVLAKMWYESSTPVLLMPYDGGSTDKLSARVNATPLWTACWKADRLNER